MKNTNEQSQLIIFNLNYLFRVIFKKWYIILGFAILAFCLAVWKNYNREKLYEVKMILTSKLITLESDDVFDLNIQIFDLIVKQFRDNYHSGSGLRQVNNVNYSEATDNQFRYFHDLTTAPVMSESEKFRNKHLYITAFLSDSSKTDDFVTDLKRFIHSTAALIKLKNANIEQLDSIIFITERNISGLQELHRQSKELGKNTIIFNNNYLVEIDRLQKELIDAKVKRDNFEICEIIIPSSINSSFTQSSKMMFIIYTFFGLFLGLVVALFIDQTVKR